MWFYVKMDTYFIAQNISIITMNYCNGVANIYPNNLIIFGLDFSNFEIQEGDEDAITQAKIYLMEKNVCVEVLGYV